MIIFKEDYSEFISKDDATYAEGSFVDFAKSVKRYIKSEQMKGRFNGWDVEHYIVPEIDRSTKEIRTDSFSLVFTKDKKNMFYIETFMQPDFFATTITCPILGIKDEPVDNCSGNSSELFYNGGFNSHVGFGSMLSNYVRPIIKDIDAELGTFSDIHESKIVESDHNGIVIDRSQYRKIKNLVIKFFTGDRDSYKSGNFEIHKGGYDLVAEIVYSVGYGTYSICGIFEDYGKYKYVIKDYNNSEFDFTFDVTAPVKDALDSLSITCITESINKSIKENLDYNTRKKIASNIASWAFGSFNMNDIDDNIDFLINRWFKSKSESFKNRMYMSDTYEELAYVLADCDLNTLKAVERGLCIDDDSIAIERDYIDSFNESKITEMTSDEQRDTVNKLKADVRELLDRVKFERIPEATMAMYETDKKGFREALIQWAIECDGGNSSWTIDKIYVGSLEGKAPILYKFNNALSLIMLTTGNGAIVKIAKSGSTKVDPPWTKLDAMQTLYSWLTEYVDQ